MPKIIAVDVRKTTPPNPMKIKPTLTCVYRTSVPQNEKIDEIVDIIEMMAPISGKDFC